MPLELCRLSDYGYGTHAYLVNKKVQKKNYWQFRQ